MQPPTRKARRNGSGIASGRGRGGGDGASAGTADECGRQNRRPNKNPARRVRTGLQGAGRQRCHREGGCHRRRECGQHFCRGSEPCVHRFDCPGGGPICAACCRAGFSHSRLQETSAGRNLITLFRTVNNPADFSFRRPRPDDASRASPAASTNARAYRERVRKFFFERAETQAWRGFQSESRNRSENFRKRSGFASRVSKRRSKDVSGTKNSFPSPRSISRRTSRFAQKCANGF